MTWPPPRSTRTYTLFPYTTLCRSAVTMTRRHTERGAISIWVVTATIVMMTLVGLAVDLGGQVHAQQRAHDVAAQAARAGGQQVEAAPAVEGRYVALDTAAALRAAERYLVAAGVEGTVTITGGKIGRAHV